LIANELTQDEALSVADVSIDGPGFLNLRLTPAVWHEELSTILKAGLNWGDSDFGKGRSVNVEYVSAKSIEHFAKHIETTSQKLKHLHKEFVIDAIYSKALKATQATSLVHNMAATYLDVSGKFIMPSVAILSRLIVIDPKMAAFERANLLTKCEEDSQNIIDLIVAEKERVIQKILSREAQIKKEYAFLDDIKNKQIEALRQRTQIEMQQQVNKGKLNANELSTAVEQTLVKRIEDDEFLRDNHVFNYEVNTQVVQAEEF
jgi:hypothetical protein